MLNPFPKQNYLNSFFGTNTAHHRNISFYVLIAPYTASQAAIIPPLKRMVQEQSVSDPKDVRTGREENFGSKQRTPRNLIHITRLPLQRIQTQMKIV